MAEHTWERQRPICDYEGTSYRASFWEGHGREYEDLAERAALRRLLPPGGQRLLEIGAGFGRLADLYSGYEQVILLDYAESGLREAMERLGRSSRFLYMLADLYRIPLAKGTCDTVVTVRVLHHVADIPAALAEIAALLRPKGVYVLEYANKRNLKAIIRYLLRRQTWSPFTLEPFEFADLNFDFHPDYIGRELARAGISVTAGLAVSHFRHQLFKHLASPQTLAALDARIQRIGAAWKLSPSIFLRGQNSEPGQAVDRGLFRCPACLETHLIEEAHALRCSSCGVEWGIKDGIYDFRTPRR